MPNWIGDDGVDYFNLRTQQPKYKEGKFFKLRDGTWGITGFHLSPGDEVKIETNDGRIVFMRILHIIWEEESWSKYYSGYCICKGKKMAGCACSKCGAFVDGINENECENCMDNLKNKTGHELTADQLELLAKKKRKAEKKQRLSQLEQEFQDARAKVKNIIADKLEGAFKLIEEAQKLSEDSGVPFHSPEFPSGFMYIPESRRTKFGELSTKVLERLTGEDYCSDTEEYLEEDGYGETLEGWVSSSHLCP